jgi:hypothetical protein
MTLHSSFGEISVLGPDETKVNVNNVYRYFLWVIRAIVRWRKAEGDARESGC